MPLLPFLAATPVSPRLRERNFRNPLISRRHKGPEITDPPAFHLLFSVPSLLFAANLSRVSPASRIPLAGTALLFLSGMCGLILQVCWFREFRLIFGVTTAASSAVLAVFMAGLGVGNILLGRRADRVRRPLKFYAALEAGVAVSAALTPFALDFAREIFIATGGQTALGPGMATAARLGLAAVVLAVPTFLMGGTLPAVASAFTTGADRARSAASWLYGANTLGAVAGAFIATFFLLENVGVRRALWTACAVGASASIIALLLSRAGLGRSEPVSAGGMEALAQKEDAAAAPARLIYPVAAIAGFVFFAMELVWSRMLAPLLGGTTFTFGLILAVALAGIGLGALTNALVFARRRPTTSFLAFTCLFGAVCLAAPFAAGDRLAVLVAYLHAHNAFGFAGEVGVWALLAGLVVFPFSFVSGAQFPILVSLCGAGPRQVGRQIGQVFLWNTLGSIAGALAGGFGLLPLLTAPVAWQFLASLLMLTGVAVLVFVRRASTAEAGWRPVALAAVLSLLALWFLSAEGPTAAWRHGGVGADRVEGLAAFDPNTVREWRNRVRHSFVWEADGVESAVGISDRNSFAFYVNGKADGNAVTDAGTQIMLVLIGAALHPDPRTAFIVGLGTGETAGWLAQVPSIERVDVAELEPATLEMARRCAPVNHDALANPKVHVECNDARELLLTGKSRYDLIACEPSNPYRSGVANLFTQEFYRAARGRLEENGIFLQWLQGYEVDAQTVRTVLATLRSVFPHAEVWQTATDDLVIVSSEKPLPCPAPQLRRRLAAEPFASALPAAWGTTGAEGFLAHFMAGPAAVDAFVRGGGDVPLNTDDRNHIEYSFARTLGRTGLFDAKDLFASSVQVGDTQAPVSPAENEAIDWSAVSRSRLWDFSETGVLDDPAAPDGARPVLESHLAGDAEGTIAAWEATDPRTANLAEKIAVARAYAGRGDDKAEPLIAQLGPYAPAVADVLSAQLAWARNDAAEASALLESAFVTLRQSPWMANVVYEQAFVLAVEIARAHPDGAARLLAALSQPFAVEASKGGRLKASCFIAAATGAPEALSLIESYEPHVPWAREFLSWRRDIYLAAGHPLAAKAASELEEFERNDVAGK